ncbi:hypothetical protein [Rhizobium sp. FY34]|uniref:hypothetical protein n=1 Tax=Rhizobium sp. FY34 TaxID=2562309 RepID=UPI0010C040FF|nr:hypothetical protein [Rhizobium sp. FY34]
MSAARIKKPRERSDFLGHIFAEMAARDLQGIGTLGKEGFGQHAEMMPFRAQRLQMVKVQGHHFDNSNEAAPGPCGSLPG